ncbi:methionine-R-sulfoxide reductase B2 [Rhodotorula sp. JG-1b]|nr:methionine-R-sulfoxide reductase B2 [Rhodotorula sp. JG-1b]
MQYPVSKSDSEWRAQLTPQQFKILREKGTEMAGTGEYDKHYPDKGVYECAGCGTPLYTADMKFKSGCGWPAFFDAIPGAITEITDRSWGMERTEIVCSKCGGHQGHVFRNEGFPNPTSDRHCVNSVSIRYNPDKQAKWEKYSKDAAK